MLHLIHFLHAISGEKDLRGDLIRISGLASIKTVTIWRKEVAGAERNFKKVSKNWEMSGFSAGGRDGTRCFRDSTQSRPMCGKMKR